MRTMIKYLFFSVIVLFTSCVVDREKGATVYIKNSSSHQIALTIDEYSGDWEILLLPGEKIEYGEFIGMTKDKSISAGCCSCLRTSGQASCISVICSDRVWAQDSPAADSYISFCVIFPLFLFSPLPLLLCRRSCSGSFTADQVHSDGSVLRWRRLWR